MALDAAAETRISTGRRAWRLPLAAKLAAALIGLVALVLMVNGAVNTWLNYNQAKRAALEVQEEKARSAAVRVGEFLSDIQTQLGWTTGAEWRFAKPDQQRYDFIRLLRQVAAITELSYLDGQGREQLEVSRLEPDSVGSGKDFSNDPRFTQAVAEKIWFGPVEFRRGSEPYMTIALAHVGKQPGVTVADVNLKLIWDVISAIRVGDKGYAFVVDGRGRLIAHPDLSLVLRDTDFSGLPQVRQALDANAPSGPGAAVTPGVGAAEIAASFEGGKVLTAYAVAPKPHWIVFVQQPLSEALASVYKSLIQTLALLGLGLLLALIAGGLLARRMVVPIRRLQQGAERLGAGDLSQRLDIRTGDEIETLADRFNQMAGRIQESYETLEAKVEARTKDLNEALQQQTATAEVLKVISRSAFDLQPVLDTLIASAVELSGANWGAIYLRDGEVFRWLAASGAESDYVEYMRSHPRAVGRSSVVGRVALSGGVECIADMLEDKEFELPASVLARGRGVLGVPLLRDGKVEGAIVLSRYSPGPYSQRQIDLVQTFADQAVIAIENVRLFDEVQARTRDLSEALQQQTATAEVLKVISRSAFDLQKVLDTLIESAVRLVGAFRGAICLRDGDVYPFRATYGEKPEFAAWLREHPATVGRGSIVGRVALSGEVEQIPDAREDREHLVPAEDYRSLIGVPLQRNGETAGALVVVREAAGAFNRRQVDLLQTFADQAVIAIENVRLFDEVQARTRDLSEALQQQTATAEVLKVISRSVLDLDSVLQTLIDTAVRLARGSRGTIFIRRGDALVASAFHSNVPGALREYLAATTWRLDGESHPAQAAREGRVVHVPDLSKIDDETTQEVRKLAPFGAGLWVPLIGDGQTIGVFGVPRDEPVAFTEREIEIVKTFADQAVIAIENARLFDEVQARTKDLSEALQQQTATSDVLKVISRSTFDLQAVFNTLVTSAVELGGALTGTICVRDGDVFRYRDSIGAEHTTALAQYLRDHPAVPGRSTVAGRVLLSGKVERIPDCLADPEYAVPMGALASNVRSLLGVPLLRKDGIEGAIILTRVEPGDFSERQIEIVQTFADQAVIALENVRLFDEVQARTRELAASLDDLRRAQDRLIQSEKLASLGQLTAGIAHEIKNPLNFVNNFSALSRELIDELRELVAKAPLDDADREEAQELIGMIDANLDKVETHGKRADSIVKNMLLHSREGSGERTSVNVNAMVEEALNLAYHGARAEKPGFKVTIERSLDPEAGSVHLYAQEMTRVLLNLISNGFYATTKRAQGEPDRGYEPTLAASTRDLGDRVEIAIQDNGTGIPDEVKAKIFNPFFTTKPAGEGTGLGLSLSHDIVVKQHGGTIEVSTEPGAFTRFAIVLPRAAPGPG